MKLSLDLKNITVLNKLKGNFSILLWVAILVVAFLTGLVVFNEVRKITQVQTDTSGILDRIVRVKLSNHENLEKRLGENSSFQPVKIEGAEAFSPVPLKTNN